MVSNKFNIKNGLKVIEFDERHDLPRKVGIIFLSTFALNEIIRTLDLLAEKGK